jgi:hypothetical protein
MHAALKLTKLKNIFGKVGDINKVNDASNIFISTFLSDTGEKMGVQ